MRAKEGYKYYLDIEAKASKPTKNHQPAIWEAMLGTVYAMSPEGEIKDFGYEYEEAKKFAGITEESDLRVHKLTADRRFRYGNGRNEDYMQPRPKQLVLWIKR